MAGSHGVRGSNPLSSIKNPGRFCGPDFFPHRKIFLDRAGVSIYSNAIMKESSRNHGLSFYLGLALAIAGVRLRFRHYRISRGRPQKGIRGIFIFFTTTDTKNTKKRERDKRMLHQAGRQFRFAGPMPSLQYSTIPSPPYTKVTQRDILMIVPILSYYQGVRHVLSR